MMLRGVLEESTTLCDSGAVQIMWSSNVVFINFPAGLMRPYTGSRTSIFPSDSLPYEESRSGMIHLFILCQGGSVGIQKSVELDKG